MELYFVTSNINKFTEAKRIITELKMLELDLDEIQELNPTKIIEHKLNEARKITDKNIVVEDVSLSIDSLSGLPGPLIKWFIKTIGNKGIYDLVKNINNKSASVTCYIGTLVDGQAYYFNAVIPGELVEPRGENGFGFDPIFKPIDSNKTLAEMIDIEKEKYNVRARVFEQLKLKFENDL